MTGHARPTQVGPPVARLTEDGAVELYHYPSAPAGPPPATTLPPHAPAARGVAPVTATPVDPTPVFDALKADWMLHHPG